jgi:type II secretory pathway pseudopilin PulG
MAGRIRQWGFSVAEVLIAVGILAVAMMLIAGVFPVGIRFTQISIDRTTAAIVANEAFAKIQLCAQILPDVNNAKITELSFTEQRDFNDWFDTLDSLDDYLVDANTFSYPTDNDINFPDKQYCWSALLRSLDSVSDPNIEPVRDVQVTIFVSRRAGPAAKYYIPDLSSFGIPAYGSFTLNVAELPSALRIKVEKVVPSGRANELEITDPAEKTFINDGDLIVDDPTGRIYRVVERYKSPNDDLILLDKDFVEDDWQGNPPQVSSRFVWVVAPGTNVATGQMSVSGKSPCVGIYQKVIRF